MNLSQLGDLISWDIRINCGASFDSLRAMLLLIEVRLEQYVYRNCRSSGPYRAALPIFP